MWATGLIPLNFCCKDFGARSVLEFPEQQQMLPTWASMKETNREWCWGAGDFRAVRIRVFLRVYFKNPMWPLSCVIFPRNSRISAWQMLGLHLTQKPGERGCVLLLRTMELNYLSLCISKQWTARQIFGNVAASRVSLKTAWIQNSNLLISIFVGTSWPSPYFFWYFRIIVLIPLGINIK